MNLYDIIVSHIILETKVNIPERSGAFLELYRCIYPRNVTECLAWLSRWPEGCHVQVLLLFFQQPMFEQVTTYSFCVFEACSYLSVSS